MTAADPARQGAALARVWAALRAAPYAQDFYGMMRALDNAQPQRPRLGAALRPADEPVRLGQDVELGFAPAAISSFSEAAGGAAPRVGVRFLGLFGPQGPLPLHLTEYVHDRLKHAGDNTFQAFADIFHHRMLLLFYRAWAQSRPALWLDRDDDARFDTYVGALFGAAAPPWWQRDAVPDAAKRRQAGLLARGVKHAEGLRDVLAEFLRVPVRIESWVGHWMAIRAADRSRLGGRDAAAQLGGGALLGAAVWDRQYKFRIHLGPLSRRDYERFLPGADGAIVVRDWVRQYVGLDLAWDLSVGLRGDEVAPARLDGASRLGLIGWLGKRGDEPRADLVYTPEPQGDAARI